ncbi:hypothetical protein BCR33DRAFT_197570 [Rhizoclosmatium globosum]|uniref:DUSP domain-containing protein n=1 Tax=Rhizoclosmatium globosum TaxID=329046 RepID=A0A1Y2CEE6_9FUNG|nr:hypothetical protein BCR33DRAFT_197570 [Rhizoclosmatium globosum]|eukprot:ORY45267.1 hypothetical protein BCR33DRAFT_197570 [Rhizoclosmatium globosum]
MQSITFRVRSLYLRQAQHFEFWCYKCTKWMGKQTEYVAETHFTDKIISAFLKPNQEPYKFLDTHFASWNKRRYIERGMYKIVESDRLYMLSRDFLLQWREFLLSNAGPPDGIDNWSLIINAEEGDEDGFTGRDESEYRIHPDALPFRDFGLISERDYLNLYSFYGGGPSLSVEQNIPTDDPIYSGLLQRITTLKANS